MMYKLCMKVVLALSLTFAIAAKSHAVFIGFAPPIQPGVTGDFVSMDLVIDGLGDGAAPSVGVWDLDVLFDDAVLAVDSWDLSDELGDIGLFEALDASLGDLGGGVLALSVVSFLTPGELDAMQGSSITLATITFEVLDLDFGEFTDVEVGTIWALGTADFPTVPIDVTATGIGRIGTPIPEPASIAIVLLGLLGLRRKLS